MQSLLTLISQQAKKQPEAPCIQDDRKNLTRIQFLHLVEHHAQLLKKKGIVPGDRVLIPMENSVDAVVAFFAISGCQGTAVLVDPKLPPDDFYHLIRTSDPAAILTSTMMLDQLNPTLIKEIAVWNFEKDLALDPRFAHNKRQVNDLDPDTCLILFTSGTSGHYKGVMLRAESLITVASDCGELVEAPQEWYCILPLYHIYPLVCMVIGSLVNGRFLKLITKENIFQIFQTKQPAVIILVPRFLEFILSKIKANPALIELLRSLPKGMLTLVCGGSALSEMVSRAYLEMGLPIHTGYGLSETAGLATFSRLEKIPVLGSVGVPTPHIQVKIDNPDESGSGEICLKGQGLLKGYFKDPKATAESIREGWLHTGDLGRFDEEGNLFITGRIKDIIVLSSGKKAMPENIESQYAGIPGIKELSVFAVRAKGQPWDEVHAAVVPENRSLSQKEISDLIYEKGKQLPSYLQIQKVHIVDEIPKTSTLKVRRALLKKKIESQQSEKAEIMPVPDEPIYHLLIGWLSETTGLPSAELDPRKSFAYYGIDSLSVWQLCEKVNEEYAINLSPVQVMDSPTIVDLAEYCKRNLNQEKSNIPPVTVADRTQELPVSFSEIIHWHRGQDPCQNFIYGIELRGELNPEKLQKSFEILFKRHEMFRTTYHQKGAQLVRKISPKIQGAFQSTKEELPKILKRLRETKIDLKTLPLFMVILVQHTTSLHTLVICSPRLLMDGMSLALVIREASDHYRDLMSGKSVSLQPDMFQYADYAKWQKTTCEQGLFQSQEQFWKERFQKMQLVPLPGRKKILSKEEQNRRENLIAGVIPIQISPDLCARLTDIGKLGQTSLQVVLASLFQIALYIVTRSPQITIRELNSTRKKTFLKKMIGYLNTGVGIIADFQIDQKFTDFLIAHQKQIYVAMMNTDLCFEDLVGKWGTLIQGHPHYSLNVSYNFLSLPMTRHFGDLPVSFANLGLEEYLYPPGLELDFILSYGPDNSVRGAMYYRKAQYDESAILPIAHCFNELVHKISHNPTMAISAMVGKNR